MKDKAFLLLEEKWIRVINANGEVNEISLISAFQSAHLYGGLSGELPTQDLAILRLMLAVMHAVFSRYELHGQYTPTQDPDAALQRWISLWNNRQFPIDLIESYLRKYQERFWLFHPDHPFFQVSPQVMQITKDGISIFPAERPVSLLIGDLAESDNKIRLFPSRTHKRSISYGEAARWLVYANGFDIAPGGRPAQTGRSIKGYGLSWLNRLGLTWISGNNLFETLLLNFSLSNDKDTWGNQKAEWENETLHTFDELCDINAPFPDNPAALFTMQFRYFQLISSDDNGGEVVKYNLWSGKTIDTQNALMEPMTQWTINDNGDYMPRINYAPRQMWRDLSAILASGINKSFQAGVVKWVVRLRSMGVLDTPYIRVNTASVTYKNSTTMVDTVCDSVKINSSLFNQLHVHWINRIIDMVTITDDLVKQLGYFARQLAKATGCRNPYHQVRIVSEQVYFRLDEPFREWLTAIDPEQEMQDMDDVCDVWWLQAQRIVRNYGEELIYAVGPRAYSTPRIDVAIRNSDKEKLVAAPDAYNYFLYRTSSRQALHQQGHTEIKAK